MYVFKLFCPTAMTRGEGESGEVGAGEGEVVAGGGGDGGSMFTRRPSVEKDAKVRNLSFPHLSIKTHQKQCCHFASIRRKHRAKSGAGLK